VSETTRTTCRTRPRRCLFLISPKAVIVIELGKNKVADVDACEPCSAAAKRWVQGRACVQPKAIIAVPRILL
jgi:hypothetical protein